MPKEPPRRAKRKEIDGQAILTSELLTMEIQKEEAKGDNTSWIPKKIEDQQKAKEETKKENQKLYYSKIEGKGKNM